MTLEHANQILEKQLTKLEELLDNADSKYAGDTAAVAEAICHTYTLMYNTRCFEDMKVSELAPQPPSDNGYKN